MKTKMEQFPAKNPNPVLSVVKDGKVTYSNEAGDPLLSEWGARVGEKLPSYIIDFVQRVISRNSPEKMEVKAGKRVYSLSFYPLPEEECVNVYGFDISDQKELERKLRESEEDLAEVQKMAHIGNWKWNIVTNELRWSDEVYRIFGLNPQEFEATFDAYFNYVHPDDRDYLNNAIKEAFKGEPYSVDNRIITANGEERIVHTDAEITFNEDNIPVYARGIVQDITERKQIEEILSESSHKVAEAVNTERQRLFDVLETLPAMICLLTPDYHVTFANRSFRERFGESGDRHCYEYCFGRTKPCEFCETYKVLETDQPHRWEVTAPDGSVIDAYDFPFTDVDGSPMILEMDIDITEQKKAEAKLKDTLDNLEENVKERTAKLEKAHSSLKASEKSLADAQRIAHMGSLDWNIATNEMYRSDEIYRIFGLERRESDTQFGTLLNYIHPDDIDYVNSAIKKAFDGKLTGVDCRIVRPDGEERIIHAEIEVIFDEINNPVRMVGTVQDITEHRKAEEKLRESEEKYRNIVETANEGISSTNSEGILTFVNKKMADMLGYATEEIIGKSVWDFVEEENKLKVTANLERRRNGINEVFDFKLRRKDGSPLWVLISSKSFFDDNGKFMGYLNMHTDITERKKAEEKIQILADAVESSGDAIMTGTLDGTITSWNKGAEQLYGYSAEEAIGQKASIIEPGHLKGEIKKFNEKIKRGEKVNNYETVRLKKDGTLINVSATLSPIFDDSGKTIALSVFVRDITERKRSEEKLRESEEKYRNIVETANESICLINSEGVLTYVNKKMADMTGYTLEEIIGRTIWDFVGKEDQETCTKNMEKRQRGISESYEIKLIRKDGSPFWVHVNAKPLFDGSGKFMGPLNMLTDITERKKAEEALANIETARKKEIHHRIKNNLQVISSLLDLQAETFRDQDSIKDSEVLKAFRDSKDRVISMALIHEELYKGGGFDKLNFSPYIEELAKNLFLTYRLGNTNTSLKMDMEENLIFDMDTAIPLGIIVNELVSNSLKHAFTGRDEGEIQIKLHRGKSEDCKSTFVLSVSDNGIGIPEDLEIEELDSLGMQLVTTLVDQLDGELELKRDNGIEFTIKFTVTEYNNQASEEARLQLSENE